jgi:hypothetical protein
MAAKRLAMFPICGFDMRRFHTADQTVEMDLGPSRWLKPLRSVVSCEFQYRLSLDAPKRRHLHPDRCTFDPFPVDCETGNLSVRVGRLAEQPYVTNAGALHCVSTDSGDVALRNPITGIGCCARAPIGQVAAALPPQR